MLMKTPVMEMREGNYGPKDMKISTQVPVVICNFEHLWKYREATASLSQQKNSSMPCIGV